jgi:hypothetical protein
MEITMIESKSTIWRGFTKVGSARNANVKAGPEVYVTMLGPRYGHKYSTSFSPEEARQLATALVGHARDAEITLEEEVMQGG